MAVAVVGAAEARARGAKMLRMALAARPILVRAKDLLHGAHALVESALVACRAWARGRGKEEDSGTPRDRGRCYGRFRARCYGSFETVRVLLRIEDSPHERNSTGVKIEQLTPELAK